MNDDTEVFLTHNPGEPLAAMEPVELIETDDMPTGTPPDDDNDVAADGAQDEEPA
ncbi:hypothetical protein ACQSSU_20440 [Micromonospora echinospora]